MRVCLSSSIQNQYFMYFEYINCVFRPVCGVSVDRWLLFLLFFRSSNYYLKYFCNIPFLFLFFIPFFLFNKFRFWTNLNLYKLNILLFYSQSPSPSSHSTKERSKNDVYIDFMHQLRNWTDNELHVNSWNAIFVSCDCKKLKFFCISSGSRRGGFIFNWPICVSAKCECVCFLATTKVCTSCECVPPWHWCRTNSILFTLHFELTCYNFYFYISLFSHLHNSMRFTIYFDCECALRTGENVCADQTKRKYSSGSSRAEPSQ